MFPLKKRAISGYKQGQPTFYSSWHIGTDWRANYVSLYAPFDGEIVNLIPKAQAPDGGNTIWFKADHDKTLHRFLHLDKFLVGKGRVKEGQQIAITGNTGKSTAPHLHHDISRDGILRLNDRSNFIDPEKYQYDIQKPMYPIDIKATVVFNRGVWPTAPGKLQEVRDWYKTYSENKLNLIFTVKESNFSSIPTFVDPTTESATIDEKWFDANVLDRNAHTTILVVRDEDFPNYYPGAGRLMAKTLGFFGRIPTKTILSVGEHEMSGANPSVNGFVDFLRHELRHSCGLWNGFYQIENGNIVYYGQDTTYKYFYHPGSKVEFPPERCFQDLDYQRIINTLKGTLMAQIKTQAKGASRRILLEAADWNEWLVLCKVYGKDPNKPEETV